MWWIIYRFSWLEKNEKATINPINKKDNKSFQYAVTVALYREEIGKHSGRITKIKSFISKYDWKGINFPPEKDDWKKFEKNNVKIAHNVLYAKKQKIYINTNREKQVILLMIPNGERWYYLAVKKLSALLRGITSKYYGDFYCLNCLHSFRTKYKLKSHKKVCENKDFCNFLMPSEDTKTEFNQYQKSDKAPFVIYADLQCLIEKID